MLGDEEAFWIRMLATRLPFPKHSGAWWDDKESGCRCRYSHYGFWRITIGRDQETWEVVFIKAANQETGETHRWSTEEV